MRPIHLSDLHFAATALRGLPAEDQHRRLTQALSHADIADRYRKRLRKAHPQFGLGTLTSAFPNHDQIKDHSSHTDDYLQAMLVVITTVLHRAGHTIA